MKQLTRYLLPLYCLLAVQRTTAQNKMPIEKLPDCFIVVLGNVQDAGYPQAGCMLPCCKAYWQGKEPKKLITSLALVDRKNNKYWLFEATPDITAQLHQVQRYLPAGHAYLPDGIFITHAHIGHYAGLMQLGREAMGAKEVNVWALPRFDSFLRNNGPWSQLVSLKNIQINLLRASEQAVLGGTVRVTPLLVPHRDEYAETAGFVIENNGKKLLFIPDIDKWEKWNRQIIAEIGKVDIAMIDGTFYAGNELPGRNMSEVPHPFVSESMELFKQLPLKEKNKVLFIHFNHTNPLLRKNAIERELVRKAGFGIAEEGMVIPL